MGSFLSRAQAGPATGMAAPQHPTRCTGPRFGVVDHVGPAVRHPHEVADQVLVCPFVASRCLGDICLGPGDMNGATLDIPPTPMRYIVLMLSVTFRSLSTDGRFWLEKRL